MREIKFRAWHEELKVMCEVIGIEFVRTSLLPYMVDVKPPSGHSFNRGSADQFILMQYTGLKDKNGIEIYEGDIVKCAISSKCSHEIIWMKEVPNDYLGGMPGFYLKGLLSGYSWMEKEEVIGNIMENKELLK